MRFILPTAVIFLLAVSAPAHAGNYNFNKGSGSWKSTKCVSPLAPPVAKYRGPEAKANDLNEQVLKYNQYLDAAQAYMYCLSQEAQDDVVISGQVIVRTAQDMIDKIVAQANASAPLPPVASQVEVKANALETANSAEEIAPTVDKPPVSRQSWKMKGMPEAQPPEQ